MSRVDVRSSDDELEDVAGVCYCPDFPLMQCNKDDVEVVVNDGLSEDKVFANKDTEDGQDARGLGVLLLDHDVLHIGDVLL